MPPSKEASEEVVIELGNDTFDPPDRPDQFRAGNANIQFPPLLETFRGRWRRENLSPGTTAVKSGVLGLPMIPGIHIALNISMKRGRVFDPLSDPKHERTLQQINRVLKTANSLLEESHPVPEQIIENMNGENVATWLHWMKELVNRGKARVVSGTLDRQAKGRIRVGFHDSSDKAPIFKDEFDKVREGAHPAPAGMEG